MSVLKNFENIPRSPTQGATGPVCNFFFQFANRSLAGGMRVQGGLSPHPRAAGGAPPTGAQGEPVAPPRATGCAPSI